MSKQMHEIDVKEIMKELREEIKTKGYKADELSFQDISIVDPIGADQTEQISDFSKAIQDALANRRVDLYYSIVGNPIKTLIKRSIRKVIGLIYIPISLQQERYNTAVISALVAAQNQIVKQEEYIRELKEEIELLKKNHSKG